MNKTSVAQQARTALFLPPAQGILQRKCACGNHTMAGEECAECAKKKSGLQRKFAFGASNDPLEHEADRVADQVMAASAHSAVSGAPPRIQRYAGQAGDGMDTTPASVDRVLAGSGRPLEPTLRQDMEQRFGHDFSRVRVHSGAIAEQSARDVNASAYTVGHNMVFGAGRFAPGTQEGLRLLAHELTHVVQQSGADGRAAALSVQRQPTPQPEIEMPAEWVFAADKRKRTDKRYARSLAKADAARIRKAGTLSPQDKEEVRAKLDFFEGDAWQTYSQMIRPALVEVTREEIQMLGDEPSAKPATSPAKAVPPSGDVTARLKFLQDQPTYIDNNIKEVNYFFAEQANINYRDGSKFELGLIPKWMKPPVVEVNCNIPIEDIRPLQDAMGRFGFLVESEMAASAPRTMPYQELLKTYGRYVDFYIEKGTARVVPSRINMLTAPTLCKVIRDSEKQFVAQAAWAAHWGTEVAKVIPGMGGGGFAGGGNVAGRIVGRQAASRSVKVLTEKIDDLLVSGGSKTFTVEGVVFENVVVKTQGSRLAVRRFRIERVNAPPGHGSVMSEAFEDAAAAVARRNGMKSVTIDVGIITNPGWREWLESLGYVFSQTEGGWIKTIKL